MLLAALLKSAPRTLAVAPLRTALLHCKFFSSMAPITEKSSTKSFGGQVKIFSHASDETKTDMTFAVYLPEKKTTSQKFPVLYWLSGLTCTEQNFITKAGAQKTASDLGLMLVCPDTSPRGAAIEGEDDGWDFGTGAGFYVDATAEKWATNYRMYSYVTSELPGIIQEHFPDADTGKASIFGHSMGGHGALICALKNPSKYRSVSAFAPICNPIECAWGQKAFGGYLGDDKEQWKQYDASELASKYVGPKLSILSDQGSADGFLEQKQLLPDNLITACSANPDLALTSRMQDGYDHSYYFISSFVEEHIKFHAKALEG